MKTKAGLTGIVKLGIVVALLSSCGNREEEQRAELNQMKSVTESLAKRSGEQFAIEKIEMQKEMNATLNEIDQRLDLIRDQKGYIVLGTGSNTDERNLGKKDQIMNNIAMMDALLEDNAKKIKSLESKLKRVNGNTKELEEQLALMRTRNSEVETEIAALRGELAMSKKLNDSLSTTLNARNVAYADLEVKHKKAEDDAYSIYYVAAKRSDLKKMKITEGSLFSREMSVSANQSHFKKADLRQVTTIPVESKKAKLVTEHDEKSYKWEEKDGQVSLQIIDPNTFWRTSKYLVIETRS